MIYVQQADFEQDASQEINSLHSVVVFKFTGHKFVTRASLINKNRLIKMDLNFKGYKKYLCIFTRLGNVMY